MDEDLYSLCPFSLFIQSRTPDHEMMPPSFREDFLPQLSLSRKVLTNILGGMSH